MALMQQLQEQAVVLPSRAYNPSWTSLALGSCLREHTIHPGHKKGLPKEAFEVVDQKRRDELHHAAHSAHTAHAAHSAASRRSIVALNISDHGFSSKHKSGD
jgi:hypothetical protein